jgi:serine/threonine protein kinase
MELMSFVPTKESNSRGRGGSDPHLRRETGKLRENDTAENLIDTEIPAPKDEWIGRTLDNYKILERVGEGAVGIVYRAEDVRLKRQVAVKLLGVRFLGDRALRQRFLREAQAAASVDHPAICTVYDIGDVGGRPYIVTAYLEGETLEKVIQRGKQPFSAVLDQVIQLAEGLQAAHAKGVIHRDLKPSNVILSAEADEGRRATIIDFGLAQVNWGDRLTRPGLLLGTANYICPQLLRGEAISEQSDIWSLGVMLYEMLTGQPPFDAEHRERLFYIICHENPAPLTSLIPELPYEIERIVAKALEKDAGRRYGAMSEFLNDLQALKRRDTVSAERAAAPLLADPSRSSGSKRALVAIGAIAVAACSWFVSIGMPIRPASADSLKRIAVMPFEDSSAGERGGEYVSRSLGESLSLRLADLSNVQLVSSSAVSNLLARGLGEHEVSSRLHLDFLVTGFIERSAQTLRVTTTLVSGRDSTIVSLKKVDVPRSDLVTMQNQFADCAARDLRMKLGSRAAGSTTPAGLGCVDRTQ